MKLNKINYFLLLLGVALFFTACKKSSNMPWEYIEHDLQHNDSITIQKIQPTQKGLFAVGGSRFHSGQVFQLNGSNWSEINIPRHRNKAFYNLDEDLTTGEIMIVGYDGNILTQQSNSSWQYYDQPHWNWMQDVAITPNGTWTVAGEAFHNGRLFHIQSNEINLVDTFDYELSAIDFSQFPKGFIFGYGTVLMTQDGGQNWEELNMQGDHFKAYHNTDNFSFLIGYEGTIWKKVITENAWEKVRKQPAFPQLKTRLRDIHMLNDYEGFIVGDNGRILHTKDQWEHFQILQIPSYKNVDLLTVTSINNTQLWIGTSNGKILEILL